jgi:nicotinate-nucleotide pyrophosphorylase (carboxylating)
MEDYTTLLPPSWKKEVKLWLEADTPKLDWGGFVVGDTVMTASILGKSPGVIAGTPFADAVFEALGCSTEWLRREGEVISAEQAAAKEPVARVTGPARLLLLGERTALNCMARASGVATAARAVSELVRAQGWKGTVCGTRKFTPGFGLVEKYSLLVGGCTTHRMDLSAMIMLKDNHIWACGSIDAATRRAKAVGGHSIKVEVEVRDLAEAKEAAAAGADVVMLDNFTPTQIATDAKALKEAFPHVVIEASGGITADTISGFLDEHVDVISQGALTQGYGVLDYSMKLPRPDSMAAGGEDSLLR